MTASWQFIV